MLHRSESPTHGLVTLWIALCICAPLQADEPSSAVRPLIKLLQDNRLPAERLPAVVEMICKRGNEHDLSVILERVLHPDAFSSELREKAMTWLADAATTRKIKPASDLRALEKLVVGEAVGTQPRLQEAAIRLASTWRDSSISPPLRALALDPNLKPELKRVALEGLVAIGDDISRETLVKLVEPEQPMWVRMRAAGGLAASDLKVAARAAARILADATPEDDSGGMISAFLDRKTGAQELAAEISDVSLEVDVAKRALRYMYSVGRSDAELSNVLSAAAHLVADAPPPTPEEIAKLAVEVLQNGDPERGESIFRRKDLNCLKCHSVSRAGGQVGPELSAVGGSSPVDYVLNSILNPNLAIKEQFVTRIFELSSGRVLTGVVVERDEVRVKIRDANAQIVSVPTADIENETEGKSLMPEGVTKFLTRDELVDLARFVSELGKPGPYAVRQSKTVQRWRCLRTPSAVLTDDVPHLEHIRQLLLASPPTDWEPSYGMVDGRLPLRDLPAARVLILQGEVVVNTGGAIRMRVETSATAHIWIDADARGVESDFEVMLAPGRHTITIRAERSSEPDNDHLRVELTTPDASPANFELVGGA